MSHLERPPAPGLNVSLVMPVRNEQAMIAACLESVLAQTDERVSEILVVDGMSDDGTRAVLESLTGQDARLVILDNGQRVQTAGLNLGIRRAAGDVIIRLDAHAVYPPDYVSECLAALESSGAGCVGGGVNLLPAGGTLPTLFGLVQEHPFGTGVARFRRTNYEGFVDTVWPGAYRREVFEVVGLFREALTRTEDLDFHSRLRQAGFKIWQTPRIRPYYRPRLGFGGLAKQYFANGQQVVETLLVNRQAISPRHLMPLAWLTILLVFGALASAWPLFAALLKASLALYVLVCLGSAAGIAWRHGWRYLFLAPWVFPWIHGWYGLGSLWGAMRVAASGARKKINTNWPKTANKRRESTTNSTNSHE